MPITLHWIAYNQLLILVYEAIIDAMPKDSESYNKNDNNSSQMIVMPPGPRVEEVLLSDEEQVENDPQSYEAKLNEKLRDLDLYEDGMTIQQKEELISVVIASWETAEKEKSRRQFYQEYMNAAEAFCNDEEIEFSFPEQAESSNDVSLLQSATSCLDVSMTVDSPSVSGYSNDCGSNSLNNIKSLIIQPNATDVASDSSYEACENEAGCSKASDYEVISRPAGKKRGRPKKDRGRGVKRILVNPGSFVTQLADDIKSDGDTDDSPAKSTNERSLEHSLSLWKPCASPKDIPLTSSKRPWCSEEDKPFVYCEADYSEKIVSLVRSFDLVQNETKDLLYPPDDRPTKPFHLTHRVHYAKKAAKPDRFDVIVGVADGEQSSPEAAKLVAKSEPFSRTSGGAFRYVKSSGRPRGPPGDLEMRTTRSGLRYDPHAPAFSPLPPLPPEEGPCPLFGEVEVILDEEKLPHFAQLKEGSTCDQGVAGSVAFIPLPPPPKVKHEGATHHGHNHIVNSSCIDSDSSDCSSVIDVETIVDDEIEDFVLKRKMLPDHQCKDKEGNPISNKRLKRNTS